MWPQLFCRYPFCWVGSISRSWTSDYMAFKWSVIILFFFFLASHRLSIMLCCSFEVSENKVFLLQAVVIWTVLCLPGNLVTIYLMQQDRSTQTIGDSVAANDTHTSSNLTLILETSTSSPETSTIPVGQNIEKSCSVQNDNWSGMQDYPSYPILTHSTHSPREMKLKMIKRRLIM